MYGKRVPTDSFYLPLCLWGVVYILVMKTLNRKQYHQHKLPICLHWEQSNLAYWTLQKLAKSTMNVSPKTPLVIRVSARVVGSWPPAKSVHKGIISFHDSWPFMLHYYFLFIKYDLHQFSTIPTIPKQSFIMLETLRDKLSQKRS